MHFSVGQQMIDLLRGKSKIVRKNSINIFNFLEIPIEKENIINKEIDILFNNFDFKNFNYNNQNRRYLTGVNAMQGVTETSLTELCKLFPNTEERKNIKVLNVACGRKSQNDFVKTLGFQVYGIDFDIENDTEFVKFHDLNSEEDLPFEEGMFDCIIAQEIIEHVENPWLLYRKIKKVLKLNGYLIITTPNIVSNNNKMMFITNNYGFFEGFNNEQMWQHINPIPYWEMRHIANYNGFEMTNLTGNWEYYVRFLSKGNDAEVTTLNANDVLIYVFNKKDDEIKRYQPLSTYIFELSHTK